MKEKEEESSTVRGRGNREENESIKNDQQAKRAHKRKMQRQKKKEQKKLASGSVLHQNNRKEAEKTPEKVRDSTEPTDMPGTIHKQDTAELKLKSMNESASKKKRPFDYNEQEESKVFSLKDLDPE